MSKRISGIVFLLVIFLVPLLVFYFRGSDVGPVFPIQDDKTPPIKKAEQTIAEYFPGGGYLRELQIFARYLAGEKEQDGIYIGGDTLMLDVQPKSQDTINLNTLAMVDFVEDFSRPTYVMLIPTACAVLQDKIPATAPLYNQKQQLIDAVYQRVSGHITAIDVYPALFGNQKDYIYYRTDNSPTGLGGYYIYSVAAKKLGQKARGLEQFDVEHLDYDYYGDLYEKAPYTEVRGDRVSAYIFSKYQRSYQMTHYDENGARRYFTLYPKYKEELGDCMDVILGGMSPVIDIDINSTQYNQRLLIFGDRSVQSYLPFLLIHYAQVTVVDVTTVTPELLQELIHPANYNQILFAFSADTFISKDILGVLSQLHQADLSE